MIAVLHEFVTNGTSFVVGGRVVNGEFENQPSELIPTGFESMFTFLSEE